MTALHAPIGRLSDRQVQMLRDLSLGIGFDILDPADYWTSGSLGFKNRDRVISALERKGLIEGDRLTELGIATLAALTETEA